MNDFESIVLGMQKKMNEFGIPNDIMKATIEPSCLPKGRACTIIVHPVGVTFKDVLPKGKEGEE